MVYWVPFPTTASPWSPGMTIGVNAGRGEGTRLRSREQFPLRVMILPFIHLGPKAKGWRAPGSRRAVLREKMGALPRLPPWRLLAVAFAPAGGSPSPLTRRGPVRPRGWGSRPTAGLAPVTGQAEPADYLASDQPDMRCARPHAGRHIPGSAQMTPHERALGNEPGRRIISWVAKAGIRSRVIPGRRSGGRITGRAAPPPSGAIPPRTIPRATGPRTRTASRAHRTRCR